MEWCRAAENAFLSILSKIGEPNNLLTSRLCAAVIACETWRSWVNQYRIICACPSYLSPELLFDRSAWTTRSACCETSGISVASERGNGMAKELGIRPIWPETNTRSFTWTERIRILGLRRRKRPSYDHCLGVRADIRWCPIAQSLDVQCPPVRRFLLGICDTVKHQPEGSRKVHRYTCTCWGAHTEIG